MLNKRMRSLIIFVPSIALGLVIILELIFHISISKKTIIYILFVVPIYIYIVVIYIMNMKKVNKKKA